MTSLPSPDRVGFDGSFPAEFDAAIYRQHPDLASFSFQELASHYESYGREEGRYCNAVRSRGDFVALLPRHAPILEIGPFYNPQVTGPQVAYFDVLDQDGLRSRASAMDLDASRTPMIDYVSAVGDLAIVDRRFEAALSVHCIEHQPDLVEHLRQVGRIVVDGGHYFLIIPDKRYCFDRFLAPSQLVNIIAAHVEKRRVHSYRSVLEHRCLTCHNDPARHWRGDHGTRPIVGREALQTMEQEWSVAAGGYIDVHAWQFTPAHFAALIDALHRMALSPWRTSRIYATLHGTTEFFAILEKAALEQPDQA